MLFSLYLCLFLDFLLRNGDFMKKISKNGVGLLKHGRHSDDVKSLQQRLDLLPMSKVDKMEFQSMLDSVSTSSFAFDLDKNIKLHLIESIKDTDKKLMSYMADLVHSQQRLAKVEKDVSFHSKVLSDLKVAYLEESDVDVKKDLYLQIQEGEKTVATFERRVAEYITLRNKIRAEIDKNDYNDKALKMKHEQSGGSKAVDVDFSVMDVD